MNVMEAAAIREQVDRILGSRGFARSERMRRFLEFIVDESLAGRGETLKESVIAHHVYRRSVGSDGGDPIVRVDARRLRDKLREYYGEHLDDPVVIELPKGGYAPVFTRSAVSGSSDVPTSDRPSRLLPALVVFSAVAVIAAGRWLLSGGDSSLEPARAVASAMRVVPVTSYVGHEIHPSLSPDGSQVAFASARGDSNDYDIYVKVIGEDRALRLTSSEASDRDPSWSPDGRWIAFVRIHGDGAPSLYLVSPLGGDPRKLLDGASDVSWLPDSTGLIFGIQAETSANRAIYALTRATQELRQLTFPEYSAVDIDGAVAPDGRLLAFVRCATPRRLNCDVFVADLQAGGEAARLTELDLRFAGLAWMPDGSELVASVEDELYRVPIARGAAPQRLGFEGASPSVAASGTGARLAFRQAHGDAGIWRTPIRSSGSPAPAALGDSERLIDSTRGDLNPVVSPDGRNILFASNRGGTWVAWIAEADGSDARPFSEDINGAFSWSPSGSHVAGLCVDEGDDRDDICVVDVETRQSTSVAPSPYGEGLPLWSADGENIYFVSDRTGRTEIWRALGPESELTQLTNDGAMIAGMSWRHTGLFYYPGSSLSVQNWAQELWRLRLRDGSKEKVLDRVYPFAQTDAPSGLYWLDFADGRDRPPLVKHLSRETGRTRELGRLAHAVAGLFPELAVDPDERYLYTAHVLDADSDILMIDGFR